MSSAARNVRPGEEVVLDVHPHWWYFWKLILVGVPLFVLLIWVLQWSGTIGDVAAWTVGLGALVWAGWLALSYAKWRTTEFVVTSERVIYRTGVVSRRGVEIPLDRVTNINFHQRLLERIIGAGDLDIQSAGEEGTTHFDDVRHPDGVQQEIYRQMESSQARDSTRNAQAIASAMSSGTPPASGAASVPEQIEQLARLRDQGHITAEEFERKKAQLLDRM